MILFPLAIALYAASLVAALRIKTRTAYAAALLTFILMLYFGGRD